MLFDKRVLLLLPRCFLACALALPVSAVGCGGDGTTSSVDPAGDGTGDTTGDTGGTADAGSTTKPPLKDSGTVKVAPASDAGAAVQDATIPRAQNDGGVVPDTGSPVVTKPNSTGDAPTSASASAKGPYAVKTYTSGYPDAPEYADSTIHYPDGLDGPLVAIAIVPGYVSPQASIQPWGPFLASHGIVAMTIGTNAPMDDPPTRSTALLGALATIKGENTREGSPLKGKLDLNRLGVAGWSMGGGGTLITANTHPELKAAMALCPWDPGTMFANITVPTLFLAAQYDVLAGGQSQPFYNSIPASTPKLLWERAGAQHQDNNDPANEMGAVGRYGLSWLKVYLEGDDRYKQFLLEKAPNASDWLTDLK
ncbi:MAG: poly(ethylene terephthalate) hydrolase [Myxococcaceae bacterium]|nr:poly(ethylene terephthalate) hydrolase [Myxococcaceae bacterium]